MLDRDRERALEMAIAGIDKAFGKGSIMKLGESSARLAVESIPTGSIALDLALGELPPGVGVGTRARALAAAAVPSLARLWLTRRPAGRSALRRETRGR